MCYELPTEAHREFLRWTKERLIGKLGLLCFSRNWHNPVLWSHYADKHRGICPGFDADDVVSVMAANLKGTLSVNVGSARPRPEQLSIGS